MSPHGVERILSRMSIGVEMSGVRFWNFTALAPAAGGHVDELLGDLHVAVVVDADLADHVDGLAGAQQLVADGDGCGFEGGDAHGFLPFVSYPDRCLCLG